MAIDWDSLVLQPLIEQIFGEPATYIPAAGQPFQITGVFDEAYSDLQIGDDGAGITTEVPVLGVRIADFPSYWAPRQADQVIILSVGITYRVREVRLDGHGYAKLMLNQVDPA